MIAPRVVAPRLPGSAGRFGVRRAGFPGRGRADPGRRGPRRPHRRDGRLGGIARRRESGRAADDFEPRRPRPDRRPPDRLRPTSSTPCCRRSSRCAPGWCSCRGRPSPRSGPHAIRAAGGAAWIAVWREWDGARRSTWPTDPDGVLVMLIEPGTRDRCGWTGLTSRHRLHRRILRTARRRRRRGHRGGRATVRRRRCPPDGRRPGPPDTPNEGKRYDLSTIADTMRASVMTGVGTLQIEDRPVPTPGPHEVLVEVAAVGVCGSDVHYYRHGRIGDFVVEEPMILGHELSGRIAAVGEKVDPTRVGQRVAVEPQHPCRRCKQCTAGRYNLCPYMEFYATPPIDGAFCRYVIIDAEFAHPVPDSMSDEAAALLEPLSVAVTTMRKATSRRAPRSSSPVPGPIGVICAQAARAFGAARIVVSDPLESRREAVLRLRRHRGDRSDGRRRRRARSPGGRVRRRQRRGSRGGQRHQGGRSGWPRRAGRHGLR